MAYCHPHYQRPSGEPGLPPLQGVWILAPGMSKSGQQEAETFTLPDHPPDPHGVSDDHTVKTTLLPLPGSKCTHPPGVKGDLVGNPNSSLHLAGIRQHPFLCPAKAMSAKPSKIKDWSAIQSLLKQYKRCPVKNKQTSGINKWVQHGLRI